MRAALALAAAIAAAAPLSASAQAWTRFAYPEAGFAVQLPSEPAKSQTTYRTAAGASVPALAYALRTPEIVYSMTVADFTKSPMDKDAALADAVKAWGAAGEVKLDVTERVDREFGRQLSVAGKDGSRSTLSIFYVNNRLYELEGKALPPDPQGASARAARFQQSLEFIGLGAEAGRPENRPGGGLGGRRFGGPPPQALAACNGKAEGDRVQFTTRRGDVIAAACVTTPRGLAARPDRPPPGAPPPE